MFEFLLWVTAFAGVASWGTLRLIVCQRCGVPLTLWRAANQVGQCERRCRPCRRADVVERTVSDRQAHPAVVQGHAEVRTMLAAMVASQVAAAADARVVVRGKGSRI